MTHYRYKLYSIMFIACIAGYIKLFGDLSNNHVQSEIFVTCFIKYVTNIPCPSCGSTRSVISLTNGNFIQAFRINPLGYVVATIMIITPLWIIIDIATKRKTFFHIYQKMEASLKRPIYAIPLILLLITNWIWNIYKGL